MPETNCTVTPSDEGSPKKKTQKTKETSSKFDSSISNDLCFRLVWFLSLRNEVKEIKEAKTPTKPNKTEWKTTQ